MTSSYVEFFLLVLADSDIKEVGGDKSLLNLLILNSAARTVLKDKKLDLKNKSTINFPIEELLNETCKLPVDSFHVGIEEGKIH